MRLWTPRIINFAEEPSCASLNSQATAATLHISESTVSRYVDRWQAMGLVEHRVTPGDPILDKKGRPRFTPTGEPLRRRQAYLSCKATPFAVEIAVLHSPPGKGGAQHGGARRPCPYTDCQAPGEEQETIERRRCKRCRREYSVDQHLIESTPTPQFQDETTEIHTDCNMKLAPAAPLHTRSVPVPAAVPLRTTIGEIRRRAQREPVLAATIAGVRRRLATADLDQAAAEYAHQQVIGPQLQDETSGPLCPICGPVWCTCPERLHLHRL